VKPSNVMISEQGAVKITDFGLAKDESSFTNTMTIASGGTLYYMSPEHIKGFSFIDKRSDIYSIGMTFYEMLTGQVPFKDITSDFELRETIVRKEYAPPSSINADIPQGIESIVLKSLAKDTDKRFQSAEEMLQAIEAFESGKYVQSGPKPSRSQSKVKSKLSPRLKMPGRMIALAVSIIIVLSIFLFWYYPSSSVPPSAEIKPDVPGRLSISGLPLTAKVFINDDSIGSLPVTDMNLPGGTYSILIDDPHYYPLDTTILLERGNIQKLNVDLKKKEAPLQKDTSPELLVQDRKETVTTALIVKSEPSAAEVWIDEKSWGKTPLRINELSPQSYQIRVEKQGFENYEMTVNLASGKPQEILARLEAKTAGMNIITEPVGAQVVLNGNELKDRKTPLSIKNIPAGTYILEIKKTGFSSIQEEIELKPNEMRDINHQLIQMKGTLSVQVKPWGSIYLNNKLLKESTDIKYVTELPVGTYTLEVIHPTLGRWHKSLQVEAESAQEININFAMKVILQVNAFDENGLPVNGNIYLDGVDTGLKTPAKVEVRPGMHRLTIKKTGYFMENGEREFLIEEDSTNSKTIILKKFQ